ncbi:GNAT family N-acetyltransferase [Sediminibacillus albus]|uniref:Acetyltransferase (GNAT) family protein n=1 Tax=Sediminibacillus albus TaxID=407036 RepID=A0A1G9AI53_9BACI|nr:GNAT family N-acetyltransferase [Sediminibacillus albus]SDK26938.1 Acetyltransferase (GNAT) family protein [Sediminibacillus albus]
MTVNLVAMDESTFAEYYRQSLKEYAYEHVKAGNWKEDEAVQNAQAEFEQLLPDGLKTKGHVLLSVMHGRETIGILWLNIRIRNQEKQAFIYDVKLDEEQRGKGLGTRTMEALDEYAKSVGVKQIRLHVFGHNHRAKSLYEKTGYEVTDYHMQKRLL